MPSEPEINHFDTVGAAFEQDIYGGSKGYVRLRVLCEDLYAGVPELRRGGLRVLDLGGGAGRVAIELAQHGNAVTLCDPSRYMTQLARAAVGAAGVEDAVDVRRLGAHELDSLPIRSFDVALCHAVLEWLDSPRDAVVALADQLAPAGTMSLMFYNENAAILKGALGGARRSSWGGGAKPLAERSVRGWLSELGLAVRSKAGIRIFYDHMTGSRRAELRDDEILAIEQQYRNTEPFASLGQHIHFICSY